ncbi:MAG: hypothetical protein GDA56_06565 [Hormoscilla sp. GM7CHS1pb]|nr:hypothetical protein [Hormoscilla sp. GM7CHS1pb]
MKGAMKPEREGDRIYKGRFEELKREVMIGIEASSRGEVVDGKTAIKEIRQKLDRRCQEASGEHPRRRSWANSGARSIS